MDNFIVSARKYRPATFESVVGQSHITSTLRNAISRNQLAHAYLFCGPRGVGKTTCARIFAKAINCISPQGSEACGECESCRSFSEGRSFSIHELDAASNNSVDDIRALTDQVRVPPQVGRYSVYIIDEVHMLSAAAFNAFLKTLEEPPAHAIFILATTEKHKIIPTILSRCQIYDFNRIRVEDSVGYLRHIAAQEGVKVDDESLNLIAQKADGGMRDALSMFDKAVAFCGGELDFRKVAGTLNVLDYDTYFTVTDLAAAGDYKAALLLFDEVLREGFSGLTFIAGLNVHFRDLLMCRDSGTLPLLEVTGTLLDRYKEQSARMDAAFLFQGISLLSAVDGSFRTATNQRLHVELGLMKLCGLAQKKTELTNEAPSLPPLQKDNAETSSSERPDRPARQTASASEQYPNQPAPQTASIPAQHQDRQSVHSTAQHQDQPGERLRQSEESGAAPVPCTDNSDQTPQNINSAKAVSGDIRLAGNNTLTEPSHENTATTDHWQEQPYVDTGGAEAPSVKPVAATSGEPGASQTRQPVSPEPREAGPKARRLSGVSIQEILNGNGAPKGGGEEGAQPVIEKADPRAEEKILAARDKFLAALSRRRPRVSAALETMTVVGNRIHACVASDVLREDILLHQKEILGMLAREGGISGPIEIEIAVREDNTAVRPIRPEDKLEHLRAKNPLIDDLRRELNLEME